MRGFTACPFFVWGFPGLRSCIDLAVGFKDGSGIPLSWLRSRRYTRFIFAGPCPGIGSLVQVVTVRLPSIGSPALLGLSTGRVRRARDRPDEARELARDRGDGDGLQLAPSDQRPVTPVQATLRLPGDLANRARRGRDLLLLLLSLGLVIAAIAKDRSSIRILPPVWIPFALWAAWAGLSLTWSLEPERSLKEFRNEIGYAALAFWVCYVGAQSRNAARVILPVLAAATVLVCHFNGEATVFRKRTQRKFRNKPNIRNGTWPRREIKHQLCKA